MWPSVKASLLPQLAVRLMEMDLCMYDHNRLNCPILMQQCRVLRQSLKTSLQFCLYKATGLQKAEKAAPVLQACMQKCSDVHSEHDYAGNLQVQWIAYTAMLNLRIFCHCYDPIMMIHVNVLEQPRRPVNGGSGMSTYTFGRLLVSTKSQSGRHFDSRQVHDDHRLTLWQTPVFA